MVGNNTLQFLQIKCFGCSSQDMDVDYKAGDVICGQCGIVQADRLLDQRDETRIYEDDNGQSSSRTSGLGESLGSSKMMFVAGPEKDRLMLERAQRSAADRKENLILMNLVLINELSAKMNLTPGIKAKASSIFQQVLQDTVVRTARKDVLGAACIYLACRAEGYPRLLDEVAEASSTDLHLLTRFQSLVVKRTSLVVGRMTAADLINRFARRLHWAHAQVQMACEMARLCVAYELYEAYPPQAVAAAVLIWIRLLTTCQPSAPPLTKEEVKTVLQACYAPMETTFTVYKLMRPSIAIVLPEGLQASTTEDVLAACPKALDALPLASAPTTAGAVSEVKKERVQVFRTPSGLKRCADGTTAEDGTKKPKLR